MTQFSTRFLVLFLIGAGILSIVARLLPHPANFTPIAALALFAGVYAAKISKWYLGIPLVAMALSDLFIGVYEWKIMAVVYGSFLAVGLFGLLVAKKKNVGTIILGTLGGSILFYLTTNFAVWAFTNMYPPTPEGLMMSYTMALPFFRNTILGDLFYTGLFFGAYELAVAFTPQHKNIFSQYICDHPLRWRRKTLR